MVRREAIAAQLAALAVEADVARRSELAVDRAAAERQAVLARQETARLDPVTSRVAQLLQIPHDAIDLTVALAFGLLLACVACLAGLQARPDRSAGESRDAPVIHDSPAVTRHVAAVASPEPTQPPDMTEVASHAATTPSPEWARSADETPDLGSSAPVIGSEALALANAIAAGQVRPTVAEIRRHLRCSQAKAAQPRRTVMATLEPAVVASRPLPALPRLVHSASVIRVA
ncbi:hypothetical protein DIE07_32295 [Burkholderia sp. Bp9002]|nr:hypothetical protein DIE07_32295 [Burkholderia sp. Bp9002]